MNAMVFAEWLQRQGHRIIRTESSYWYNGGPGVYQAFPYHAVIEPPEEELARLFRTAKVVAARYSTPLDAPEGLLSYHAIYDSPRYEIKNLRHATRQNVRRGLANCTVARIPFERLAEEGWDLQVDTLQRQNRKVNLPADLWRERCLAARDLKGFEAWGALVGNRLGASMITFRMDDWIYLLYQQSHRDFLHLHLNNALAYTVTSEGIARPGVTGILYGLHSLDAPGRVDEFKFRMGYKARPVRQRVVIHPAAAPLVGSLVHRGIRRALLRRPGNPTLSKAEGIIRFYVQGRLPLDEQPVPVALERFQSGAFDVTRHKPRGDDAGGNGEDLPRSSQPHRSTYRNDVSQGATERESFPDVGLETSS